MNSSLFIFFDSIRWQDLVDIGLNSYILFRLYVLLRGTRMFRILIGILFLWFLQKIADSQGLIVTSWAMQAITAVSALIIIVVFSHEIRNLFRTRDFVALLWGFPKKNDLTPVEVITDSIFKMASRHCGALLVFPGRNDLSDILKSGIATDSIISREIIQSIFWQGNPVHDGAVIIENNRITHVASILPLSDRTDLPKFYGTRHRAAKGLAESTDAMVVLVSEEKGNIMVAKGMNLEEIGNPAELKKHLKLQGVHDGGKGNGFAVMHLKTMMAALMCVIFVTGIWYGVTRGISHTLISLEAPIEYINRDPEMNIIDTTIDVVRLRLSGSDVLVNSIKPDQVRVKVDMAAAKVGYNSFVIENENIILPPGINLSKIDPRIVEMNIDAPKQKIFPIQPDWTGILKEDLILASIKIYPKELRLKGNTRVLYGISTVYTEKLDLNSIKKSGEIIVKPVIPAGVSLDPKSNAHQIKIVYIVNKRDVEEAE
ncbi:diadenylate cyclase [Desulfobacterales bacterium HSG16]|nr:diadenylate cyclase [Desulfobacterales bacterium HSG16]